jgi:hypothetical protein
MKGTKKNSEGAIGSVNPPRSETIVAAKSFDNDSSRSRFSQSQDDKVKPVPVSDRPPAQSKSDKTKKKAVSEEKWPFASITPQDLENEIRERAFYIYLQGGNPGNPGLDWLQAEAEIKRKYGING